MIHLLLAARDDAHRRATIAQLKSQSDFELYPSVQDAAMLLIKLSKHPPDLVILEDLDTSNAAELHCMIHARFPQIPVLLFTNRRDIVFLKAALKYPPAGFLAKGHDDTLLPDAVRKIASGKDYFSRRIERRLSRKWSILLHEEALEQKRTKSAETARVEALPPRPSRSELRLLSLLARGTCNAEIARELSLSAGTVRNYVYQLVHKMGFRSRTELALYAQRTGLAPLQEKSVV